MRIKYFPFAMFVCLFQMSLIIQSDVKAAQFQHQIHSLSSKHGLSQNTITDIAEDSSGDIWLGSQNGLNRFDGVRVTNYLKNSTEYPIAENEIIDLEVDDEGKLWVLTRKYILRQVNEKFEVYLSLETLAGIDKRVEPRKIKITDKSILFIDNQAVTSINRETSSSRRYSYPVLDGEKLWFIMDVLRHKNNLVLSTNKGLWIYDSQKEFIQKQGWPDNLKNKHIQTAIKTPDGFAVNGAGDIFLLDSELKLSFQKKFKEAKFSSNPYMLSSGTEGAEFWLASSSELFQWQYKSFSFSEPPLNNLIKRARIGSFIYKLFVDSKNNIWIGTSTEGVFYLTQEAKRFQTLESHQSPKLSSFAITEIYIDQKNELWIGTSTGSIYRYVNEKLIEVSVEYDGLMNKPKVISQINSITRRGNQLWIGTYIGILIYDIGTREIRNWYGEAKSNLTFVTVVDSKLINEEFLIVSSNSGIFWIDPETEKHRFLNSYSNWNKRWDKLNFTSLFRMKDTVYFGTLEGEVITLNLVTSQFSQLNEFSNLNARVFMMTEGPDDTLWFISSDALFEYNPVSKVITRRLSANEVGESAFYSIEMDSTNKFWIGGSSALITYDSILRQSQKFADYEGVINNEYNSASLMHNENLYSGTVSGIVKADTSNVSGLNEEALISISRLVINRETGKKIIPSSAMTESFQLDETSQLVLDFKPNNLSYLEQIHLRYKLDDGQWINIDDWTLKLNSNQLGAGYYELTIQSSWRYSNNWKTNYKVSFEVLGLFGLPIYFYWLLAGVIGILLVLFFNYSLQLRYRSETLLEKRVKKRTRELSSQLTTIKQLQKLSKETGKLITSKTNFVIDASLSMSSEQKAILDLWKLWDYINRNFLDFPSIDSEYLVNDHVSKTIIKEKENFVNIRNLVFHDSQPLKSNISPTLIKAYLKSACLFVEHLSPGSSISVNLDKSSARRGSIMILSQIKSNSAKPTGSRYFFEFETLFKFLSTVIQTLDLQNELIINDSLFSWNLVFPVAQKWRGVDTLENNESSSVYIDTRPIGEEIERDSVASITVVDLSFESCDIISRYLKSHCFRCFHILQENCFESVVSKQNELKRPLVVIHLNDFNLPHIEQILDFAKRHFTFVLLLCSHPVFEYLEETSLIPNNLLTIPNNTSPELVSHLVAFLLKRQTSEPEIGRLQSIDSCEEEMPEPTETAQDQLVFVQELNSYLEDYCSDESLDVEKVAFALNLSSRHLARKVKLHLGTTTAEYIKQYRLQKALKHLNKGLPIVQVSKMSGFSSRSYFSTCFKKEFGVVPSEYKSLSVAILDD